MNSLNSEAAKNSRKKGYRLGMESAVLLVAFLLSVIGIGITDFRPLDSYRYWGAMTFILAITGMVMGWARQKRAGLPPGKLLITQMVHWAATFVAVAGIFFLLVAGRLNYENTGLVLLLTLGLSTFLDGYRVSWGFGALGVMMFLTALLGAYIEQYVWVVLIVIICTAVVIIVLEKSRATKLSSEKKVPADSGSASSD